MLEYCWKLELFSFIIIRYIIKTNTGDDLVSTWVAKQRRAYRGSDYLVNPSENNSRKRRKLRFSRLIRLASVPVGLNAGSGNRQQSH